jgi:hypothetical protein
MHMKSKDRMVFDCIITELWGHKVIWVDGHLKLLQINCNSESWVNQFIGCLEVHEVPVIFLVKLISQVVTNFIKELPWLILLFTSPRRLVFLCRSSAHSGCNKERKYRVVSLHSYNYTNLFTNVFNAAIKLTSAPLQIFSLFLLALANDTLDTVVQCCDCVVVKSNVIIILNCYRDNVFTFYTGVWHLLV